MIFLFSMLSLTWLKLTKHTSCKLYFMRYNVINNIADKSLLLVEERLTFFLIIWQSGSFALVHCQNEQSQQNTA